jgi:hypothetical protein
VAAVAATAPKIRHEDFCLPRPDAEEPRVESFRTYGDDPATGRSRPTHMVHRCLECGAANYQQIGA